jgi:phosphoserine phosphatase RsbU/P
MTHSAAEVHSPPVVSVDAPATAAALPDALTAAPSVERIAGQMAAALAVVFPAALCIVSIGRSEADNWQVTAWCGSAGSGTVAGLPRAAFRAFFRAAGAVGSEAVSAAGLPTALPAVLPIGQPRSILAARGLLDGQVVSSVFVVEAQPREADQQHRRLISFVAAAATMPLQVTRDRALLAAQVARVSSQLADTWAAHDALLAISATLVEQRPLPALLTAALHVAVQALHFDAGNVRLYDAQGDDLVLGAQVGFGAQYESLVRRIPLQRSPLREVFLLGEVQTVARDWHQRLDPQLYPRQMLPQMQSALSVPMVLGTQRIGVLNLFRRVPSEFQQREIALARSLANQLAVLTENRRLIEQRDQRLSELDLLGRLHIRLSAARTLEDLVCACVSEGRVLFAAQVVALLVWDEAAVSVRCGAVAELDQPLQPVRGRLADLPAAVVQLIAGQPADGPATLWPAERGNWLTAVLTDRDDRPLGLLAIAGARALTAEWLRTGLAPQVALQLENMLLLEQRARQIRELEVIGRIGAMATSTVNLQRLLEEVQALVLSVSEAAVFYLLICEAGSRRISHSVFVEEGRSYSAGLIGQILPTGTLSDLIVTTRAPLLLRDLAAEREALAERGYALLPVGPRMPVQSWLGVPLLARDGDVIGVLSLQHYRPYTYDEAAVSFLTQVAAQVSLGVQKIMLFADRERQLAENTRLFAAAQAHAMAAERHSLRMELINRISSLLAGRLDRDEIVAIATRELVERFWSDGVLFVIGGQGQSSATLGSFPAALQEALPLPPSFATLAAATASARRPLHLSDIVADPRGNAFAVWQAAGVQSVTLLPLISRDSAFGTLVCVARGVPRSYSGEELDLLMAVAVAVATAFESARLFAAEQDQRRTADTLREMARVVSSSFDLDQVLALVLTELARLLPYRSAVIALRDSNALRVVSESPFGWHRSAEIAPAAAAAAERAAAGRSVMFARLAGSDGTYADWVGVPLIAHHHVLGVLSAVLPQQTAAPERAGELLTVFADHAALAIENASLYQQSVTRVEQELSIARQIQSRLFPRRLPQHPRFSTAAHCLPAHETGGDFYDVLEVDRGLAVLIGDVSGKSLPAAMIMAVARSVSRSEARSHTLPRRVLAETNDWLIGDLPPNAFVALGYALFQPDNLTVTLAGGGQIPPLLRRADGTVVWLEQEGALPLGLRRDARYSEKTVQLAAGDLLVFTTDGVVSAQNGERLLYGFDRLAATVRHSAAEVPQFVIDAVLADLAAFCGDAPYSDDVTIVVVAVRDLP